MHFQFKGWGQNPQFSFCAKGYSEIEDGVELMEVQQLFPFSDTVDTSPVVCEYEILRKECPCTICCILQFGKLARGIDGQDLSHKNTHMITHTHRVRLAIGSTGRNLGGPDAMWAA